jgi:putative transposase
MIFRFMRDHSIMYPVETMAKVLGVSRSGYYQYTGHQECATKRKNGELLVKIKEIGKGKRQVYGSPRIHAELLKLGEKCSRQRVARIMRANEIQAKTKKKWKATTKGGTDLSRIAPNKLNQNFVVDQPNKIWVTDITYVPTQQGWVFVSAVLDLYSRKIVGLSMDANATAELVVASLDQAVTHRRPSKGLIVHSDRGSQYTGDEYKKYTDAHGFELSMSGKGNCYDNAAMETFFHTLKGEHVFFDNYLTRKEAMESIFEYIEVFYNRQRSHSTLGYMTPAEFEAKQEALVLKIRSSRVELARPAMKVKLEVNDARIHTV